jgi:phytanoyl-CoA hydroxylase
VTLTPAHRSLFERDGLLVLERYVPAEECAALRARAAELVAAFQPGDLRSVFTTDEQARKTDDYFLDSGEEIRFFFEEDALDDRGQLRRPLELALNKIGHALHDLDPAFSRFSRHPRLRALAEGLGMRAPVLLQSMYIFKQPHIGGEVDCHQDATFLHARPHGVLGLWIALEDADRGNGCLWALPGAHRQGLKQLFVREGRATRSEVLDASPWDLSGLVPLEVPIGSVVALDGLTPHLSRRNESPRSRHAYTLHLVEAASELPSTNWLQRRTPPRGF